MEITVMEDVIEEIVVKVARGELKPKEACSRLRGQASSEVGRSAILDFIWLESLVESDDDKLRLQDLVSGLVQEGILLLQDVIAHLEAEVIPDDVCSSDLLRRKRTQAKTKRVYTVPKFNVFSECPEGYASLVDMLWSVLRQGCSDEEASQISDKLRACIGYYQLCPTKAVSVVISLLSHGPDLPGRDRLISFLQTIGAPGRVSSTLFFHLLEELKDQSVVTSGLPTAISLLIHHGLVDVPEIWSVMTPKLPDLSRQISELESDFQRIQDGVSRTLAGAVGSPEEGDQMSAADKMGKCLETFSLALGSTQRFQLLAELIRSNQFDTAMPLLLLIQKELGSIPIGAVEVVRTAMLEHVSCIIADYMDGEEVSKWLLKIMKFLGVFVGTDHVVLGDILKFLKSSSLPNETSISLLGKYLLPSLGMGCPNPFICSLAWECISGFSPEKRSSIYQLWEASYDSTFPLSLVRQESTNQTRSLLKRVVKGAHIGDTVSRNSHYQFAKLCCCNPLVALKYIVSNIQIHFNYNLIEPYVEVTSKIPALAQDIVSFLISGAVSLEVRPSLNLKTASVEPWLSNLSEFTGRFLKKHPATPLDALMGLISASMTKSKDFVKAAPARVLLEAIIDHMGDFSVVHQLNAEQIEAISGGPVLNSLFQASQMSTSVESVKLTERAKTALKQALLGQPGLVQTIYHSLGSQLSDLTTSQQVAQELIKGGGLKLLGILHDGIHLCILQLTEFLSQNCDESEYRQALACDNPVPLFQGCFDPGMAFHVLRPGWSPAWTDMISDEIFSNQSTLSKNLYGTFWRLSLSDICVPVSSYSKQGLILKERISAQESLIEKLEKNKDLPDSKDQLRTARRELVRLKDQAVKMEVERERQTERHAGIMAQIREEAGSWWIDGKKSRESTLDFISAMISQRVFLSIQDAIYCSHFIQLLIREEVQGFDFVDFYDQWTALLALTVTCSSEGEIKNLAEFVREMMSFVIKLRNDDVLVRKLFKDPAEVAVCHARWEGQLTKALKMGLDKDQADWCEKRNCLIMISKTCDVLPVIQANAVDLIENVQALGSDPQEDIATLATALGRKLSSLESNWLDRSVSPAPPSEDAKMEDTSERDTAGKRPPAPVVREKQTLDRPLEEPPKKPQPKRAPKDEEPAEPVIKRPRSGDDRERPVTRSRNREPPPPSRPRERGGNTSRRRD